LKRALTCPALAPGSTLGCALQGVAALRAAGHRRSPPFA